MEESRFHSTLPKGQGISESFSFEQKEQFVFCAKLGVSAPSILFKGVWMCCSLCLMTSLYSFGIELTILIKLCMPMIQLH